MPLTEACVEQLIADVLTPVPNRPAVTPAQTVSGRPPYVCPRALETSYRGASNVGPFGLGAHWQASAQRSQTPSKRAWDPALGRFGLGVCKGSTYFSGRGCFRLLNPTHFSRALLLRAWAPGFLSRFALRVSGEVETIWV